MQITYPGPYAAVQLPTLGLTVEKGETVDLDEAQARQLIDQGWKPKAEKKTPTTKTPAAAAQED